MEKLIDTLTQEELEKVLKSQDIILYDVEHGMCRASGIDEHGNQWLEFEVDTFAEETPGECSICGAEIMEGFQCLDGGEEVCHAHVQYAEDLVA